MTQNLTYIRCGDYLIPDIRLSYVSDKPLGKYGKMRRVFLRKIIQYLSLIHIQMCIRDSHYTAPSFKLQFQTVTFFLFYLLFKPGLIFISFLLNGILCLSLIHIYSRCLGKQRKGFWLVSKFPARRSQNFEYSFCFGSNAGPGERIYNGKTICQPSN